MKFSSCLFGLILLEVEMRTVRVLIALVLIIKYLIRFPILILLQALAPSNRKKKVLMQQTLYQLMRLRKIILRFYEKIQLEVL